MPISNAVEDPLVVVAPRLTSLHRMLLFAPFLFFVGAFWWVSSTEKPWVPLTFQASDKIMHAVAYAGLATWARVAVAGKPRASWWAFLLAGGYGVVDEIHQSFVPGRSASIFDVAADAMGALIAVVVLGAIARAVANGMAVRRDPASERASQLYFF